MGIRTASNMSTTSFGMRCRATSNLSNSPPESPPKSQLRCFIRPLPKADVDWLLSTLSVEELTKFERRFFLNDARRRFRELDTDGTEKLGTEKLQSGLVEMYPTLKLELKVEGHHIPALDKNIPGLIATFDSDSDGCLDFEEFVQFIKFQQAWRAQFFLTRTLLSAQPEKKDTSRVLVNSSSVPNLDVRTQTGGLEDASSSVGKKRRAKGVGKSQGLPDINKRRPSRTSDGTSSSSRCSSAASLRTRCALDPSRGAFYSSLVGLSSTV